MEERALARSLAPEPKILSTKTKNAEMWKENSLEIVLPLSVTFEKVEIWQIQWILCILQLHIQNLVIFL